MPVRKYGARTVTVSSPTAGPNGQGFTYLGFPKAQVDPTGEEVRELTLFYAVVVATTVRIVHYNSAGTIKNDITTAAFTPGAAFATSDGTLATNVVNAGVNLPWQLLPGDSIAITAVTGAAQVVSATFTIAPRGA
jgi:hypothetical protein